MSGDLWDEIPMDGVEQREAAKSKRGRDDFSSAPAKQPMKAEHKNPRKPDNDRRRVLRQKTRTAAANPDLTLKYLIKDNGIVYPAGTVAQMVAQDLVKMNAGQSANVTLGLQDNPDSEKTWNVYYSADTATGDDGNPVHGDEVGDYMLSDGVWGGESRFRTQYFHVSPHGSSGYGNSGAKMYGASECANAMTSNYANNTYRYLKESALAPSAQHTAHKESTMPETKSFAEQEQALLQTMASAQTLAERAEASEALTALRNTRRDQISSEGGLDWDSMSLSTGSHTPGLVPVPEAIGVLGHAHIAATPDGGDWLDSVIASTQHTSAERDHHMRTEATLWYEGLYEPVKGDREEFSLQAQSAAQRVAAPFMDDHVSAVRTFLDTVDHMHRKAGFAPLLISEAYSGAKQADQSAPGWAGFDPMNTPTENVQDGDHGFGSGSSLPKGVSPADAASTMDGIVNGEDANGQNPKSATDPSNATSNAPSLQHGTTPATGESGGSVENPLADQSGLDHSGWGGDFMSSDPYPSGGKAGSVTAAGLVHAPSSEITADGDSDHIACDPSKKGTTANSPDDVTCPDCREALWLDGDPYSKSGSLTVTSDTVDDIMKYEGGEMSHDEEVAFFQRLIDTGLAWKLQGSYGRMAQHLIEIGACHAPSATAGLIRQMQQHHENSQAWKAQQHQNADNLVHDVNTRVDRGETPPMLGSVHASFVTGDGKTFDTQPEAVAHANEVFQQTGHIISVEKQSSLRTADGDGAPAGQAADPKSPGAYGDAPSMDHGDSPSGDVNATPGQAADNTGASGDLDKSNTPQNPDYVPSGGTGGNPASGGPMAGTPTASLHEIAQVIAQHSEGAVKTFAQSLERCGSLDGSFGGYTGRQIVDLLLRSDIPEGVKQALVQAGGAAPFARESAKERTVSDACPNCGGHKISEVYPGGWVCSNCGNRHTGPKSASVHQAGNPYPVGTPNWFEWEDGAGEGHGPHAGVPDGGIPLHGPLTPEQEAWMKGGSQGGGAVPFAREASHGLFCNHCSYVTSTEDASLGSTCKNCGKGTLQGHPPTRPQDRRSSVIARLAAVGITVQAVGNGVWYPSNTPPSEIFDAANGNYAQVFTDFAGGQFHWNVGRGEMTNGADDPGEDFASGTAATIEQAKADALQALYSHTGSRTAAYSDEDKRKIMGPKGHEMTQDQARQVLQAAVAGGYNARVYGLAHNQIVTLSTPDALDKFSGSLELVWQSKADVSDLVSKGKTAAPRGNDFSLSDAKNEDGEWIMSPEQIRSEMAYDPSEDYDPYDDDGYYGSANLRAEAASVCRTCGESITKKQDPTGQRGMAWATDTWNPGMENNGDDRDFQCFDSTGHHVPGRKASRKIAVAWARRHYEDLASAIGTLPDGEREKAAHHFADSLKGTNPYYDSGRFEQAASTKGYGVRGGTGTANYTRGHYQHIADAIKSYGGDKQALANHMADHFAGSNSRFDRGRFLKATAGLRTQADSKAKPTNITQHQTDRGDMHQRATCENCGGGLRRNNSMASGWVHIKTNTKYCPTKQGSVHQADNEPAGTVMTIHDNATGQVWYGVMEADGLVHDASGFIDPVDVGNRYTLTPAPAGTPIPSTYLVAGKNPVLAGIATAFQH